MRFLRAGILEQGAGSFSRGSSLPGDGTRVCCAGRRVLTTEPAGKPLRGPAAAAAELRPSCPTLCDPRGGSPPGFPVPGILQARALEWGAIAFSKVQLRLRKEQRLKSGVPSTEVFLNEQGPQLQAGSYF